MRLRALVAGLSLTAASTLVLAASPASTAVTFHKDVEPILQKNCQSCHRPGETGPMPLLTYQQARPFARSIKEAVATKKMPPWPADPHFGKWENDRSLSAKDQATLLAWVDAGAPEGNIKDAPKPVQWTEGWSIGKPDAVISMPNDFQIPASGVIEYQYVVLPTGFTEDKWVQAAETRPGNRALVHHLIAFIREPGSKWLADAKPGVVFVPQRETRSRQAPGDKKGRAEAEDAAPQAELLQGFAPGLPPAVLRPGQAKLVKAGSDIVFQLHYTANGTAGVDRSKIGLIFAKEPPKERVFTTAATQTKFKIPAGDGNYKVESEFTVGTDAKLVDLMPHMHLRGKDFEYRAIYPDGRTETLLVVPHYDFNWQLFYYEADQKVLPAGTKIECTAHFDNSAANKANPDPTKAVTWGDQSWEEMMIGWFDVAIPAGKDPRSLFSKPEPKVSAEDN